MIVKISQGVPELGCSIHTSTEESYTIDIERAPYRNWTVIKESPICLNGVLADAVFDACKSVLSRYHVA